MYYRYIRGFKRELLLWTNLPASLSGLTSPCATYRQCPNWALNFRSIRSGNRAARRADFRPNLTIFAAACRRFCFRPCLFRTESPFRCESLHVLEILHRWSCNSSVFSVFIIRLASLAIALRFLLSSLFVVCEFCIFAFWFLVSMARVLDVGFPAPFFARSLAPSCGTIRRVKRGSCRAQSPSSRFDFYYLAHSFHFPSRFDHYLASNISDQSTIFTKAATGSRLYLKNYKKFQIFFCLVSNPKTHCCDQNQ